MIDDDSENKKLIETFTQKYRIKRLIISIFPSQINEMIERKHISIKDVLSKLTFEEKKNEFVIFIQCCEQIERL